MLDYSQMSLYELNGTVNLSYSPTAEEHQPAYYLLRGPIFDLDFDCDYWMPDYERGTMSSRDTPGWSYSIHMYIHHRACSGKCPSWYLAADKSGVSSCIWLAIREDVHHNGVYEDCIDFTGNYGEWKGRGTWVIFDIEIPKDLDVYV